MEEETEDFRIDDLRLRFASHDVERDYQLFQLPIQVLMNRVGAGSALFLNAIYYGWDRLAFATAAIGAVTQLRQIWINAFLTAIFATTFHQRLKAWRSIHAGGVVLYAVFFAYINTLEQTSYMYIANGILIVIWPYLFTTGNFSLAVATGMSASVAFTGILAAQREVDLDFVLLTLLVFSTNLAGMIFHRQVESTRRREYLAGRALTGERARFRDLLVRVLPERIADRLHRGQTVSDTYPRVVVLFADVVGFTAMASRHPPDTVVRWLNELFGRFDDVMARHGLEKIKTIGDAYMAASGLDGPGSCERAAEAALELVELTHRMHAPDGNLAQIRVGLNAGPALAGIIGTTRFLYDLWGDTVNVASRMEAASRPGAILVTGEVRDELAAGFDFEMRPAVDIKGKGPMTTWVMRGRKEKIAARSRARVPGEPETQEGR